MGKVTKNKMVVKQCPKCDYQVPVACKLCRCGHGFFSKRFLEPSMEGGNFGEEDSNGVKRRRTERVKRERPDFYSASEYESQLRRMSTSSKSGEKGEEKSKKKKRHRRGRPKGSQNKSVDQIEEEREKDLYANLPREKTLIYSVVLAEINEKMQSQAWKPNPSDQDEDEEEEDDVLETPTSSQKQEAAT